MTIPFLDLFKKAKSRLTKQAEAPRVMMTPRAPLPEKKAGERLSKTVMPNTTRTVAPADPFQVASGKGRTREMPAPLTPEPPEIAPGDRAISLTLSDVLENLPQSSLKPREGFDVNQTITIKAAEIEKGMATGQPTASLASIYEQAPEIFRQPVSLDDLTQVSLPYSKVLEQFQTLHVRADQMQDEAVPQLETPFLQVTIEDTKKFGTSLAPLQTSAVPPVKVEPATARSLAKAEPEPVSQEKQTPGIAGRRPVSLTPKTGPAPAPGAQSAAGPTRIPFRLPPNGTGVPASERVPASSGPPVPTPPPAPPAPPKPAAPTRIPFKLTPPNAALKPKFTLVPGVEPETSEASPAPSAEPAKKDVQAIRLRLNVCLRNLPAFQLSGSLPEMADDVVVELPYSLVEPQLASGRVAIDPSVFHQAIPEKFRAVFVVDETKTPVLLPLQEVLQHLPTSALKMRQDQELEEAIDHFETPFSRHAKEDQKRFGKATPAAEVPAKPGLSKAEEPVSSEKAKAETPVVEKTEISANSTAEAETKPIAAEAENREPASTDISKDQPPPTESEKKSDVAKDEPASTLPVTAVKSETVAVEAKNNAKEFVLRASCLPGVAGCSIAFADGLSMAGNLPPGIGAEGLCAMAPSVLQKIGKHMLETNLGALTAMTLHCAKSPLTFFMEGNVCLTVLHSDRQLEQVTQEQLADMTKELAKVFAQPETTHVDH